MNENNLASKRAVIYSGINDLIVAGVPLIDGTKYNQTMLRQIKAFLSDYGKAYLEANKPRVVRQEAPKAVKKPATTNSSWHTYPTEEL